MNKTVKITLIIVGAVLILGWLLSKITKGDEEIKVQVEKVERRNISETVTANGKIQPEVDVKITSQVSGQIVELPVKEGDYVNKGDLLIKINPDIYEASFNRARASVNNAKSNLATAKAQKAQIDARFVAAEQSYNRSKTLHEQGAISQADWDNAVANYEVAKSDRTSGSESIKAAEFSIMSANASLSESRDNLSRTTIVAPKSGTITALTKELGESVLGNNMMAGEVLMSVSDLKTMEVDVEVNESDIIRVHLNDSVDIEVDAFIDNVFKGIVTEIGNTAINASGMSSLDAVTNFSVKVRILEESYKELEQKDDLKISPFRPGMSANVDIKTESLVDVLSLPIKAISLRTDTTKVVSKSKGFGPSTSSSSDNDSKYECVLVVDDSKKTKLKVVETGIQNIDYIQIIKGLDEGERVIVSPYKQVKELRSGKEVSFKEVSEKDE